MSQRPWDYNNDIQPGTETISHESIQKLIGLKYENWLNVQQSQGSYNAPISHYHPSTVKEFLIYYRQSKQNEWSTARYGSDNQVSEFRFRGQGYEASDGSTYARYNILSAFENDTNSDIKKFNNTQLESFISRVYEDKNRTFNAVNKVDSHHQVSFPLSFPFKASYRALSLIFSAFSSPFKDKQENGPLGEPPRASEGTQSLGRSQSMPGKFKYGSLSHPGAGLGKRKRGNEDDSGPEYPRRTSSAGGSSYFNALKSGNKNLLEKAEDLRFEKYKKEEERREEEAKQKGKKPQQPQRASSFPSQRASQIHNPLIGPDGGLKKASTIQSSPLTRKKEEVVGNRRPRPAPRQPLSAKPASSKGVGASPSGRY